MTPPNTGFVTALRGKVEPVERAHQKFGPAVMLIDWLTPLAAGGLVVIMGGAMIVIVKLLIDIVYAVIDPRIRLGN